MHIFRTHNCNELSKRHINNTVRLAGWVHKRRDHGNLLFIDLRDYYGITQLVFNETNADLKDKASYLRYESVITIEGVVVERTEDTTNHSINTGTIEIAVTSYKVESAAEMLPMVIHSEQSEPEETRLKYRFLDLRRAQMRDNIVLRSNIISELRNLMTKSGFIEFQTPILTASSPEGARDFLVASRLHPGKFYALPQAPQQFKQMLMVSGFDKYFQIAPCFRDEDARADRSPGEFYQLDMEMSFVTQDDVFNAIEPVLYEVFHKFGKKKVCKPPFPRISYKDAMMLYGTDKPDTRNPIKISDVTSVFQDSEFTLFNKAIKNSSVVRAIPAPDTFAKSRKFFDNMIEFAISEGAKGLAYIQLSKEGKAKGPVAKFLNEKQIALLCDICNVKNGDSIFFTCALEKQASKLAGQVRNKLGAELNLIPDDVFEFCWVVDFPFYERNEDTKNIEFSHNPFSMPQGGMEALISAKTEEDLLSLKAYQYDIVCNGIELSSGAIRNHNPELMYKAFEIVGYTQEEVDKEFGGLIKAFKFGAPPHGGIAPGIDRMVMLIAETENIREVIAFPMNQKAEDLLMEAPNTIANKHLRELHLSIIPSIKT